MAPSPFSATVNQKQKAISLSWGRSTDNVGVLIYRIWRDGVIVGTTQGTTTYGDSAVTSGRSYTYAVDALDAAGNHSPLSASATAALSGGKRK